MHQLTAHRQGARHHDEVLAMTKRTAFRLTIASCLAASSAFAEPTTYGYVTPTSIQITFHTVTLIQAGSTPNDERDVKVLDGSYVTSFNRADPDFEASPFGDVDIPEGRYVAIRITYDAAWSVKLDGTIYQGRQQGNAVSGTTAFFTTGSDGSAPNSISTSIAQGSSASFATFAPLGGQTLGVSTTVFASPICVSADGKGDGCEAGDRIVGGDDPPDINVLLDLYHSVGIDPTMLSLAGGPTYPFATVGRPGAAAHYIVTNIEGFISDVSLLLTSDAKLQFASVAGDSYSDPAGLFPGVVPGVNVAPVTAAPAGEFHPVQGSMMIGDADLAGGKAQFPAGGCDGSGCFSHGLLTIDGFSRAAADTALMSCAPDTDGALGYTYAGGDCTPNGFTMPNTGTTHFTIARIVDPAGVLGSCTSTSPGFLHGGTCSAAGTADGYP
jgi:hypothetical protein